MRSKLKTDAEVVIRDALRAALPKAVVEVSDSDVPDRKSTVTKITCGSTLSGTQEDPYFFASSFTTFVTTAATLPRALKAAREVAAAVDQIPGFTATSGEVIAFTRVTTLPESSGLHPVSNAPMVTFTADTIIV